jgi:hypothetical protein
MDKKIIYSCRKGLKIVTQHNLFINITKIILFKEIKSKYSILYKIIWKKNILKGWVNNLLLKKNIAGWYLPIKFFLDFVKKKA